MDMDSKLVAIPVTGMEVDTGVGMVDMEDMVAMEDMDVKRHTWKNRQSKGVLNIKCQTNFYEIQIANSTLSSSFSISRAVILILYVYSHVYSQ